MAILLLTLLPQAAHAADEDEDEGPKPHVDTGRHGRPLVFEAAPPSEMRACSLHLPICVGAARSQAKTAQAVLASAERAWETMTGALGFPAPDVDPDTLAYPIVLAPNAAELASTRLAARDARAVLDRGRAFTVVDPSAKAGCPLDGAIATALARATLARLSPGADEGVARSTSAYVASLVAPCSLAYAADAATSFQAHPERAIADALGGDPSAIAPTWPSPPSRANLLFADGAALFWSRIDWAYTRTPGGIVHATWCATATKTPLGEREWWNEPDAFDVLRVSFKDALHSGSTLADLLLDAAVARAFFGAADDGLHQPETATLGEPARVALDWEMPWPDKPHRIAPRAPVMPTGSSYVLIHHAGAPKGARLRVELAWEEHALFRWALVKLDAAGKELARVVVPTRERATEASFTLVDVDAADRILLVGVNAGDPSYAFDPDDAVWEPHGWLLTVAQE